MNRSSMVLAAIALIFLATAGNAQVAQDVPAEDQSASSVRDLQVGELVIEPVETVIDDWVVVCAKTDTGDDQCQLRQVLLNAAGSPVATIEIWKISDNTQLAAGAVIALPLGVMLEESILLQIDEALPRRYRYVVCRVDGCYSRFGLSPSDIARMKAGKSMLMTIFAFADPDTPIDLLFSLAGFTKAFNSL